MNKMYILIRQFLFIRYISAHFYEDIKENKSSINE